VQHIEHVLAGLAIVYHDRQVVSGGYVKLIDEQLYLAVLVTIPVKIIETYLSDSHHMG